MDKLLRGGRNKFPREYLCKETIARISKIPSLPTLLTDLYFTRVTPSKQFDLLAEDFDYRLVATVVLGLVVGTLLLSQLAARKTLRTMWN